MVRNGVVMVGMLVVEWSEMGVVDLLCVFFPLFFNMDYCMQLYRSNARYDQGLYPNLKGRFLYIWSTIYMIH